MKFEKVNENKIRITLSIRDLEEKDIDFHDFMSNSIETQDLFLDMLEEAEEKIGFKTRDCKVKIEALAMTENSFVLTVTRVLPDGNKKTLYAIPKKKPKAKRKVNNINEPCLVYKFNSFDDYCNFIEYMARNVLVDSVNLAGNICLYTYNDGYYLVLSNLNTEYKNISGFFTAITEFAVYIPEPDLYVHRIYESGNLFIKNNAFKKSFSYFLKK